MELRIETFLEIPFEKGKGERAGATEKREMEGKGRKRGKEERGRRTDLERASVEYYKRGPGIDTSGIRSGNLRALIEGQEDVIDKGARLTSLYERYVLDTPGSIIAPDETLKTSSITQTELQRSVPVGSVFKRFSLSLKTGGPYRAKYSRSGRFLLLAGRSGHVSVIDWLSTKLKVEKDLQEVVRDVCFLQDESFYAAAQKKYVYIYDRKGRETHVMRNHTDVNRLEFLPYHFLLVSGSNSGHIKYQDVSTGGVVAEVATGAGPINVMRQDPARGLMLVGTSKGVVSLYSPNNGNEPLAKVFVGGAAVFDVCVDRSGNYMFSTSGDKRIRVWDVRNFKELYRTTASRFVFTSLDMSQRGVLAAAGGTRVATYQDLHLASAPEVSERRRDVKLDVFLGHRITDTFIENLSFAPFDDVLGVGHNTGFESLIIPGAGEPNIDSYEDNPISTGKQRGNTVVARLLEKLEPATISLNESLLGSVVPDRGGYSETLKRLEFEANNPGKNYEEEKKTLEQREKETWIERNVKNLPPGIITKKRLEYERLLRIKRTKQAKRENRQDEEVRKVVESKETTAIGRFKKRKKRT